MIDYKFRNIIRDEKGNVKACEIAVYEGEITTQLEDDGTGGRPVNVTRYRRTKLLGIRTIKDMGAMDFAALQDSMTTELGRDYPTKEIIDDQKPRTR